MKETSIMVPAKYPPIDNIAEANGYTRKKSAGTIETSILEIIKSTFPCKEDGLINGLGKYCVKDKQKREKWDFATREDMIPAPWRVVTFGCASDTTTIYCLNSKYLPFEEREYNTI